MKHFNKGLIFGKLSRFKLSTGEKPRLEIIIEAPNSMHGDPTIYAAAFGRMAEKLLEVLKAKGQGASLRLQGIMGQYRKKEHLNTSFTVFKCDEYAGSEYRAVFILIGHVESIEKEDEEYRIHLHVSRSVKGMDNNIEEDLVLYSERNLGTYEDNTVTVTQGQTVKLKGVIGRKEDYFGDAEGTFKPQVKEIEILELPEEEPY